MHVGLLKETAPSERRVALTPASVHRLTESGLHVIFEHGAGDRAHFPDRDYIAAGGHIAFTANEVFDRSGLIVKVSRPTNGEISNLHDGQGVMAFQHLAIAAPVEIHRLLSQRITAIGLEIVENADRRLPVLEPMSEIAGQMAIAVAGHLLRSTSGGRGILLGGAPGIPPANVVILGAGTAGTWAARTAINNGARTLVLDNNLAKLRALHAVLPTAVTGLSDADTIGDALRSADVLIGAVLQHGQRAPHIVSRTMVQHMPPGAVIVDLSIDQGGCVETSRPTTLDNPVFSSDGVLHYCVPNMTADIARTASVAMSQAILPYVLEAAEQGLERAINQNDALGRGVYTHAGKCIHHSLASRWDLVSEAAST